MTPPERMIDGRGILRVAHYGEAAEVTLVDDDGREHDVTAALEALDGERVILLLGRIAESGR